MVATSLLSNAPGVDESTSKTPSVRRKCRSGATRIERTPMRRQVAQSTRGFDSASLHNKHFAGSNAFSREPAIGLQSHADIRSSAPGARPADNFVAST